MVENKYEKLLDKLKNLSTVSADADNDKRENANIDGDSSMGTMLQFGSTVSRELVKEKLMSKEFTKANTEGRIHTHDMDFYPMGTTTCIQLDLKKLFNNGFNTGHGYLREPNDIRSYGALAAIAVQSNQNEQHGRIC